MADQTVKITGDNGSRERVALDLMKIIMSSVSGGMPDDKNGVLNLYADCLHVVIGGRPK